MDSLNLFEPILIGRLQVAVSGSPGQPRLDTTANPKYASLAVVINEALGGLAAGAETAIRNSGRYVVQGMRVCPASDSREPDEIREAERDWHDSSGLKPSSELYVLSTAVTDSAFVPLDVVLKLLDEIQRRRKLWTPPTNPPDRWAELEKAALQHDSYSKTKSRNSDVRKFLEYLDSNNILHPRAVEGNLEQLDPVKHPTLVDIVKAVGKLRDYYRHEERGRYIKPIDSPPIIGGPISFEWFRGKGVKTPDNASHIVWTAFFERTLRNAPIDPDAAWEIYEHIEGEWFHLKFRWEGDEGPSLWHAELGMPMP